MGDWLMHRFCYFKVIINKFVFIYCIWQNSCYLWQKSLCEEIWQNSGGNVFRYCIDLANIRLCVTSLTNITRQSHKLETKILYRAVKWIDVLIKVFTASSYNRYFMRDTAQDAILILHLAFQRAHPWKSTVAFKKEHSIFPCGDQYWYLHL